jgi:hypothetical protein
MELKRGTIGMNDMGYGKVVLCKLLTRYIHRVTWTAHGNDGQISSL